MNEEIMIDVVSFTDEDGKEFEMELIDEFEHKGDRYVVLAELDEDSEDGEACDCGCEAEQEAEEACDCGCEDDDDSLYIMRVVTTDGEEEFVPVEEDMLEELVGVVEARLCTDEDAPNE